MGHYDDDDDKWDSAQFKKDEAAHIRKIDAWIREREKQNADIEKQNADIKNMTAAQQEIQRLRSEGFTAMFDGTEVVILDGQELQERQEQLMQAERNMVLFDMEIIQQKKDLLTGGSNILKKRIKDIIAGKVELQEAISWLREILGSLSLVEKVDADGNKYVAYANGDKYIGEWKDVLKGLQASKKALADEKAIRKRIRMEKIKKENRMGKIGLFFILLYLIGLIGSLSS